MTRIVIVFAFIGAVLCAVQDYKINENQNPFPELPCTLLGGICLLKNDKCPEGKHRSIGGLCPLQEDQGVQCCNAVAKSGEPCLAKGGECMPKSWGCAKELTFSKATDCEPDEQCCILVT